MVVGWVWSYTIRTNRTQCGTCTLQNLQKSFVEGLEAGTVHVQCDKVDRTSFFHGSFREQQPF